MAAAADLAQAFPEVARAFTAETGQPVDLTFGSSGLLARQLAEGAPFDVFAAASLAYVDQAIASGACEAGTRAIYGRGRLVVWWRRGATVAAPATLRDLADPRFRRVAIANPEHAPYGRAAREALTSAGVWPTVLGGTVLGDNVQQALQFASSGNADLAIVAMSLAVAADGAWFAVDESLHQPLDQALVVCGRGPNRRGGLAFAQFAGSPAGRAVLRRYGFILPGEEPAARPAR